MARRLLVINNIKIFGGTSPVILKFLLISVFLGIPAILLGKWSIFLLPLIFLIILSYIFGERFIIAIIIISLFTLVGELNRSLRTAVHLIDFTLLGILFLKRFGLNFKDYIRVPNPILFFLLLYFSVMTISGVMSKYPFESIPVIGRQFAFFIVVYVFYSLIKDENDIRNYFRTMIVVACVIVIVSGYSFFGEGYNLLRTITVNRERVSAITGNIEAATNYIVVSFPLVITSFLVKKGTSKKVFNLFLLLLFSLGLTMTMSRSAVLGITLSTLIIFFIIRRKIFYRFFIILIFLLLLFILVEPIAESFYFFFRIEAGMGERDRIWLMSLNMIGDYTLFGIGPGAYKYEMINYLPYMLNDWWGRLLIYFLEVSGGANLSHNFYLTLSTEMGLFGLIAAISLPVVYFKIGLNTIKKYKSESADIFYLIVALFATGVSIILRSFFNSIGLLYAGGIQTDLPFWLIFSSLVYFYRSPVTGNSVENNNK